FYTLSSSFLFFIHLYCDHQSLHSFPTRRSSDLVHHWIVVRYILLNFFLYRLTGRESTTTQEPLHRFQRQVVNAARLFVELIPKVDRKSTRLNSSHVKISYAVFCLKKKNKFHFNI